MIIKPLVKYGLPLSFVYCTVYQQNIWREGDEKLFEEQKQSWRAFFRIVDDGYRYTAGILNLTPGQEFSDNESTLLSKIDSLDMKRCWNETVQSTFKSLDAVISNPAATGCKIYRKLQPYFSTEKDTKLNPK